MERWATFDCYGTLIDWNGGIGRELERLFGAARGGEQLRAYHELEPQIQREDPGKSYREVMAVALARLGAPAAEQDALGRSLPSWEPFPEVPAALDEARSRDWKLAVLSNTDRNLLDASLARIGVEFDRTVVASEIGSYKPAPAHWDEFFARSGAARTQHVHVAASLFHDIAPASALGLRTIWINRLGEDAEPQPDVELRNLAGLAESLDGARAMSVRSITPDDFPLIAAFLADDETHLFGRPSRLGVADVTAWLSGPDLSRDTWLVEEAGSLVALGWVETHHETGVAIGVVHRDQRGRGLGSGLVDRSEARLAALGVGRIHAVSLAADVAAVALLSGRGYREVRRFWEMTIELGEEPPPAILLQGGLRLEPFSWELAHGFHAALEESFADHWEYQPSSFEEWWERQVERPDHDPSLWFLVRIDDEVVAATRNDPERSGGGWIGALGVRPAWRDRGLAKALLFHSFREFHRRGKRRVGLGVDSENASGATKLYESVGMVVDTEQVVWEKLLA